MDRHELELDFIPLAGKFSMKSFLFCNGVHFLVKLKNYEVNMDGNRNCFLYRPRLGGFFISEQVESK